MSDQKPQELNILANRAMNGDVDAFNQLYSIFFEIASRHSGKLPPYIREEFLLDMGKRLVACFINKTWKDTGMPFESWINVTAYHAVGEWWRIHKKRSAEIQDPTFSYEDVLDPDISILEQMVQEEEKSILWSLVRQLPANQSKVIYERYYYGKSFSEISTLVGKTEENCRQIHLRALKNLKHLSYNCGYYSDKSKPTIKDNKAKNDPEY
jgi:RNA polymerase sigma factor (sigma-70 family)